MTFETTGARQVLLALTVALAAAACSSGAGSSGLSSVAATSSVASAVSSVISSTGTLLCAPTATQTDACTGKAVGDACTLSQSDGGATFTGTCRSTIDGASLGCAPTPPAPPAEAIAACSGLAVGAACTETEHGETHTGVCATAADGTTVACEPTFTPPQVAIDACTSKAAGDACTLPGHEHHGDADAGTDTIAGTCSLGRAGTGPLACQPAGASRTPRKLAPESPRAARARCSPTARA